MSPPQAAAATLDVEALERELAQLKDHLVRHERFAAVGLLLADIAHEIYNPLAWVQLNAGLLKMMVDQAETSGDLEALRAKLPKVKELLADNQEGLKRIQHVVDALRLMSRGRNGARAPEDVNEVCRKTALMLGGVFKRKGVFLETEFGVVPPLSCNGNDLAQAIMNLLVNANDAVAQSGHVRLRTSHADGWIRIEVLDDGPGVPRDVRERIFEPFFTTKPLGTGLGLPLVRNVADDHGGHVEVADRPGGGALFRLSLPAVAP